MQHAHTGDRGRGGVGRQRRIDGRLEGDEGVFGNGQSRHGGGGRLQRLVEAVDRLPIERHGRVVRRHQALLDGAFKRSLQSLSARVHARADEGKRRLLLRH